MPDGWSATHLRGGCNPPQRSVVCLRMGATHPRGRLFALEMFFHRWGQMTPEV